ncbi:WbqC family protein [Vreelandella aquamarina]
MNLAIMQPYFFPYIGYFQLMEYADEWIIFDNIQFIDKGWINRNRILHPNIEKAWQYITVPLSKRGQFPRINEVNISPNHRWIDTIMGKLTIYKKAPHYNETSDFIYECLSYKDENLSTMLERTLQKTAKHLDIQTFISSQSNQSWDLPKINHPGQWALEISKVKKAKKYVNLYGGSKIFQQDEFDKEKIKLEFLKPALNPYDQYRKNFIEGLSIIDIMMWNDKETIHKILKNDFSLLSKQQVENEQSAKLLHSTS